MNIVYLCCYIPSNILENKIAVQNICFSCTSSPLVSAGLGPRPNAAGGSKKPITDKVNE